MAEQSNAPIIIKRKKVVQGGGHHGGAWKVAIWNSPVFVAGFPPLFQGRHSDGTGVLTSVSLPPDLAPPFLGSFQVHSLRLKIS